MTDKERITKLEERLARADARIAELEARPNQQQIILQPQPYPVYPYRPWPSYPNPTITNPTITYGGGTASSTTYALNA